MLKLDCYLISQASFGSFFCETLFLCIWCYRALESEWLNETEREEVSRSIGQRT